MEHLFGNPVGEIEKIIDDMHKCHTKFKGTNTQVYIDGVGWCYAITEWRTNKDGVNEPYDIYEPVEENK